jgi:hypothetical protein
MPEARFDFAVCVVQSDIFVFGGEVDGGESAIVFKYDTVAKTWHSLAPMPRACSSISASLLDGLIYIVGRAHIGDTDVLQFDPESSVWSELVPTSIDCVTCSFVLAGCLYVAGGSRNSSTECYVVATDPWTAVTDMLQAQRFHFCGVAIGYTEDEQDLFDSLIAQAEERELASGSDGPSELSEIL